MQLTVREVANNPATHPVLFSRCAAQAGWIVGLQREPRPCAKGIQLKWGELKVDAVVQVTNAANLVCSSGRKDGDECNVVAFSKRFSVTLRRHEPVPHHAIVVYNNAIVARVRLA